VNNDFRNLLILQQLFNIRGCQEQTTADRVTNSVTSHTWKHKCFMCTFR